MLVIFKHLTSHFQTSLSSTVFVEFTWTKPNHLPFEGSATLFSLVMAMSGTPVGSSSRLDRVLDLVTEHETTYRDHETRLEELSRKINDADKKLGDGLEPIANLNVKSELEGARTAVDRLHRTVNHMQADTEPVKRDLTAVKVAVDTLEAKAASQSKAIEELEANYAELRRALSEQKKGVQNFMQEALDRIAAKFEELSTSTREGLKACGESTAAALKATEVNGRKIEALDSRSKSAVDDLRESVNTSLTTARKAKEAARKAAGDAETALTTAKGAEASAEKVARNAISPDGSAIQPIVNRLVDETSRLKETVSEISKMHRDTAATAAANKFKLAESRKDIHQLKRDVVERSRDTAKLADRVARALRGRGGTDSTSSSTHGMPSSTREAYVRSIDLNDHAPWPPSATWNSYTGPPTWTPLSTGSPSDAGRTATGASSHGQGGASEDLRRLDEYVERLKKRAKDSASKSSGGTTKPDDDE